MGAKLALRKEVEVQWKELNHALLELNRDAHLSLIPQWRKLSDTTASIRDTVTTLLVYPVPVYSKSSEHIIRIVPRLYDERDG